MGDYLDLIVIASVSEAIQRLAREAGLLRRFAPRNDECVE